MTLTKSQIDALVDGMQLHDGSVDIDWEGCVSSIPTKDMKRALYLAAGLTAEGERKPERVRVYRVARWGVPVEYTENSVVPVRYPGAELHVTPGWFVPEGAE